MAQYFTLHFSVSGCPPWDLPQHRRINKQVFITTCTAAAAQQDWKEGSRLSHPL